jgi:hypothetical protein
MLNEESWVLTFVFAPYTTKRKREFLKWFSNIEMPDTRRWLILGDFNLMRRSNYRNRDGGNIQKIFYFNEAISSHD